MRAPGKRKGGVFPAQRTEPEGALGPGQRVTDLSQELDLIRRLGRRGWGFLFLLAHVVHRSDLDFYHGLLETTQIEANDNRVMIAGALTGGGVGIDVHDVDSR